MKWNEIDEISVISVTFIIFVGISFGMLTGYNPELAIVDTPNFISIKWPQHSQHCGDLHCRLSQDKGDPPV